MKAEKTCELIQAMAEAEFWGKEIRDLAEESDKELNELCRLAEIGKYTEMAFKCKRFYMKEYGMPKSGILFVTVDELIEWGEEQEANNV